MRIINKNFITILIIAICFCNLSVGGTWHGTDHEYGKEPEPSWWPIPIMPIITNLGETIKAGGKWVRRGFIPLNVIYGIQDCREHGITAAVVNAIPVPYCDENNKFGCGLVDALEAKGIDERSVIILELPCDAGHCYVENPLSFFPYIIEKERRVWRRFFPEAPPIGEPEPLLPPIPEWKPPGEPTWVPRRNW